MSAPPPSSQESSDRPLLSILIVNWNSKNYVRKCLTSLRANCGGLSHEVIVVDGASFDGCGEMVASEFPEIRFIQATENIGFGRANNLAFEHSRGEYILLLNPDTEVIGNAIQTLLSEAQRLPDLGLAGARLLNSDGSLQRSCMAFPSILTDVFGLEWLRRSLPSWDVWGIHEMTVADKSPVIVEVMIGACVLTTRAFFERIGRFSPEYFMYSEDVDLCLKSVQAGRRNYYVPTARIIHHGGGGTQDAGSRFANVMQRESRWRYYRKTRMPGYALLYRALMLASSLARLPLVGLLRLVDRRETAQRRWTSRWVKWSGICLWCIGREGWARTMGTKP